MRCFVPACVFVLVVFILLLAADAQTTGVDRPSVADRGGGIEAQSPPDAPSVAKLGDPTSSSTCRKEGEWTLCSPGSGAIEPVRELKQKEQRTTDRRFWTFVAISSALWIADSELTISCVQANRCRELNPLFGPHPSRGRVYGIGIPLHVGITFFTYKLKKGRHSKWWLPQVVLTGGHAAGVLTGLAGR